MRAIGELHHHDATFDHVSVEEFEAHLDLLGPAAKDRFIASLLDRRHSIAFTTLSLLQQAAQGIAADQHELTPATRERRRRIEATIAIRQTAMDNIENLITSTLRRAHPTSVHLSLNQNTANNDGALNT